MRHGAPPLCIHCGKPEREYHAGGYCDSGITMFEINDVPRVGEKFVEMPAKEGQWGELLETICDVYPRSIEQPGHWLIMWEEFEQGDNPRTIKRTTLIKRGDDGRWVRAD